MASLAFDKAVAKMEFSPRRQFISLPESGRQHSGPANVSSAVRPAVSTKSLLLGVKLLLFGKVYDSKVALAELIIPLPRSLFFSLRTSTVQRFSKRRRSPRREGVRGRPCQKVFFVLLLT